VLQPKFETPFSSILPVPQNVLVEILCVCNGTWAQRKSFDNKWKRAQYVAIGIFIFEHTIISQCHFLLRNNYKIFSNTPPNKKLKKVRLVMKTLY
jgi:hypothetical protein